MPPEAKPGLHPDPPSAFRDRPLPIAQVSGPFHRLHRREHEPLYFGASGANRFDDPRKRFGVLYTAADEFCAFIETYGRVTGRSVVTTASLAGRLLARIESRRPLNLVDLSGPGALARIGADARLTAGEHRVSRRWSRAFHDHPSRPDGIAYPARHDPVRRAFALFDRVESRLRATSLGSLAESRNRTLLGAILDHYGFALLPG